MVLSVWNYFVILRCLISDGHGSYGWPAFHICVEQVEPANWGGVRGRRRCVSLPPISGPCFLERSTFGAPLFLFPKSVYGEVQIHGSGMVEVLIFNDKYY